MPAVLRFLASPKPVQFSWMVIRSLDDGWLLVTQPDHAALAGEMARHWCFSSLPGSPDPAFLTAVARHDSGWEAADREPSFHPDGSPVSFLEWPLASAVEIWRDSIREAGAVGELAGYVVRRHFQALAVMALGRALADSDRAAVQEFVDECEQSPARPAWEHLVRLLQVCDLLSLQVLTGGGMRGDLLESIGVRAEYRNNGLYLSPFPFRMPLNLIYRARFLAHGSRTPAPPRTLSLSVEPVTST